MKNTVVGDSIIFEAVLKDVNGDAVTNSLTTLTVVDAAGSTVQPGTTVPHISAGTYNKTISTGSWGYGPIVETWKFESSNGTTTEVITNTFKIVGTTANLTYISASELKTYFENVEDYFDGNEDESVLNAFNFVNSQLTTLGHQVPVQYGTDGQYDQALRDWNAWEAVFRIVQARAVSQISENNEKPWYYKFHDLSDEKWKQFKDKRVVLNRQTGPGKAGISKGTKIAGTRASQMETNWEGYGKGFQGEDFPRTWRVELLGTGTSGGLYEGTFRWSTDNGVTWDGTALTDQAWVSLKDEVYVRFHRGTSTATTSLFGTDDVFQFTTAPLKNSTGGMKVAKSY